MHPPGDGLAHLFPLGMHRAGRQIGAAIAPKNAAIENIAALDGDNDILHRDGVWPTSDGVAANGAPGGDKDARPAELLEYLRQKVGGNSRRRRNISQLHSCAEWLFG